MKVSLRAKLVALLTMVALIPLLAALLTIGIGGRHVATESFGKMMLLTASAESTALRGGLSGDIAKLQVALQHEPSVVAALAGHDRQIPTVELSKLDAGWPTMPVEAEPLAGVLAHPIAEKMRRLQEQDARFAEVLVTDRFGQLVAATARTTDYYQADEEWWLRAYNDGRGRVYIPPISYDDSAGLWSVDLCVPVRRGEEVVGVAKAVLDVSQWVAFGREVGERQASIMLVQADGTVVSRRETAPLTRRAEHWQGAIADGREAGWRATPNGEIQGFAPIRLRGRLFDVDVVAPSWVVVAYVGESEVLGDVRWLSGIALATGLAVIAGLFLAGLLLIDRSIVRRVLRLARATRRVTRGDLTHRIRSRWAGRRVLGPDEIDDLARDFNRMVGRIQHSHRELQEANEMKTDFIRIAGHELRTPVSYILGLAKLLAGRQDPERLAKAVAAMGTKARRLNDIIDAMFKLMPRQRRAEWLQYSQVKVSELLEEAFVDCQPFAERRHQRLIVEGGQTQQTIRADRAKLRDIVVNLGMNAIKFTPDGGTVRLQAAAELGGLLAISVVDCGPGIPETELPHIFEPFFSGGDVLKHSTGQAGYRKRGMGLGLTVVKHFAELHGGHVRVHSTPKGCTFTVSIPVEPPAAEGAGAEHEEVEAEEQDDG